MTATEIFNALSDLHPRWAGRPIGNDAVFKGLTTDSRQIVRGGLFVALVGEKFDGHRFVAQALDQGAAGALVQTGRLTEAELSSLSGPAIATDDSLAALGRIALAWRLQHDIPILAVTGSMGKSSVKEMAADILSVDRSTLRNQGNFNNLIGLPLTLLRLTDDRQAAVVELGINQIGEMEQLVAIAQPTVGLITNAAEVHVEYLGDLAGVARAKTALWRGMPAGATAVVNLDDPYLKAAAEEYDGPKIGFGRSEEAEVRFRDCRPDGAEGLIVDLAYQGRNFSAPLKAFGLFQGFNAAAACAGAAALGVGVDQMIEGLSRFSGMKHRLGLKVSPAGWNVLDDVYNANPAAMVEALKTLVRLSEGQGRRAAALAHMAELGRRSEEAHIELGRRAAEMKLDLLVALGPWAELTAKTARDNGLIAVETAADMAAAAEILADRLDPGDWLLVKGSRSAGLERLVDLIMAEPESEAPDEA